MYTYINSLLLFVFSIAAFNGDDKTEYLNASVSKKALSATQANTNNPEAKAITEAYNNIRCILQDRAGNFWFATDGEGVCRYDGKSFTYFTRKDGLSSNFVRSIQEDRRGNLWFGTRDGVCRYDGKSFTAFTVANSFLNAEILNNFSSSTFLQNSCGYEDLWFATRDGAYHYDGKLFTFLPLPVDEADTKLRRSQPGVNRTAYSVYSILKDKTGNLWFGSEQKGVFRYNGASFTNVHLSEKEVGFAVRCIFQDKNGNYWFGSNGLGLTKYDRKSIVNFTQEQGLSNPDFMKNLQGKLATLARVWTIAEDNNRDLWIGTIDAGVWRYDGKTLSNFTMKDGLSNNAIWTIYKDKTGKLWFGTDGGGVCTYDGKSFQRFVLPPSKTGTDEDNC